MPSHGQKGAMRLHLKYVDLFMNLHLAPEVSDDCVPYRDVGEQCELGVPLCSKPFQEQSASFRIAQCFLKNQFTVKYSSRSVWRIC